MDLESKFAKVLIDLRVIRPFYSALYESIEKIETDSVPTIGVTSKNILYNKDFLDKLDYPELLFVILHELAHIALRHTHRIGNRNHKIYNVACDLYVNKVLHEEFNIGTIVNRSYSGNALEIKMPAGGCYLSSVNTDVDYVEKIYEELIKNNKNSSEEDSGSVDTSFRGDKIQCDVENHLIDDGLDELEQESNTHKILSMAVTKYDMRNSDCGKMPGKLEIFVRETLKSHLDWRKLLRKYCIKCNQKDLGFSIPDKRMSYQKVIYPGYINNECDTLENVEVCIDVSGSISESDLKYILGQIESITKQYKMSFEVICWDTMVQKAYKSEDVKRIMKLGLAGGGGTMPECVFEYLDTNKIKPGIVLVFTDGYFDTSQFNNKWKNKYKNTLWIMTKEHNKDYKQPFGKKVIAKFE